MDTDTFQGNELADLLPLLVRLGKGIGETWLLQRQLEKAMA